MSEQQLSLLDWRPPAEVLPFPLHRSHGATAMVARSIVNLDTPKRTGRLNALRAQTRKHLSALIGADRADEAADAYVRMVRIHFDYPPIPKQIESTALILSMTGQPIKTAQHGNGGGAAGALGRGTKFLAGFGAEPHEQPEYDAVRAREEGDAA